MGIKKGLAHWAFASSVIYASMFSVSALAQNGEVLSKDICSSTPLPAYDGVPVEASDKVGLIATGLEAAETAKALLIGSDAVPSAQWCLVEDAAAKARSLDHWRNIGAPEGGALVDRLINPKVGTTIYIIRVAKGASLVRQGAETRTTPNYAAIIEQPGNLVIAGYFAGRPDTEKVFGNLAVHGRINKADGKISLAAPD